MHRYCFSLVSALVFVSSAPAVETLIDRTSFLIEDIVVVKASKIVKGSFLVAGQEMPDGNILSGPLRLTKDETLPPGSIVKRGANLVPKSILHTKESPKLHIIDSSEPSIVDKLEGELKLLKTQLVKKNTQIAGLEKDNASQLSNMLWLSIQLDAALKKAERLEAEVAQLTDEKLQLQNEKQQLQQKNDELTKQKQELSMMLNDLKTRYDALLSKYQQSIDREKDLRRRLGEYEIVTASQKAELAQAKCDNAKLWGDLNHAWKCIEYYRNRPCVREHVVFRCLPPRYYYCP